MSYDAFTLSAITVIVGVIIVVIIVSRSRAATEIKLRNVARNLIMAQSNEDARELCKELREKYPELCAGIDYTLKLEGGKAKIDEWNNSEPRPNDR